MDLKEAAVDGIIRWDGTVTASDFSYSAHSFSEMWKSFNPSFPPWLWIPCPKHRLVLPHRSHCQVDGYLSLENICYIKSSPEEESNRSLTLEEEFNRSLTLEEEFNRSLTLEEESNISQREEPFDQSTLVCPEHEVNHSDFHIIYCPSYRVPVLYFRSYRSDGQLLPFNEIEKDLPGQSAKLRSESKWTFITQEEHPYLNRPWYKLHPCGTSDWMKLLFNGDISLNKNDFAVKQYLVSWFSVTGQAVGLRIPLEMLETKASDDSCNTKLK